ncbi:MAG: DUF1475 domain-containing protein [Opitutus sp.]|nr:DUF1475 domain-containing protein [Opitutus sp.]
MLLLRSLFLLILASMLAVTSWASLRCPLFAVPREVFTHPWFIATLIDAYWGFVTFFVWVCSKHTSWIARSAWFVAIMLLGNIAMAAFCLAELAQRQPNSEFRDLLTARREGVGPLGLSLAAIGVVVIALALPRS